MYLLTLFIYSSLLQYAQKQLPLPPLRLAVPPTSPLDPLLPTSISSEGHLLNMAQDTIRLGTEPYIKVGCDNPLEDKGSKNKQKRQGRP